MTDPDTPAPHEEHQDRSTNGSRKPYQRPRILFREPLEAMAAVCSGDGAKTTSDNSCTVLSS